MGRKRREGPLSASRVCTVCIPAWAIAIPSWAPRPRQGLSLPILEFPQFGVSLEYLPAHVHYPSLDTPRNPRLPLVSYSGVLLFFGSFFLGSQVMEYWESDVVPDIRAGKRVLVVAHANTLRSLVKR